MSIQVREPFLVLVLTLVAGGGGLMLMFYLGESLLEPPFPCIKSASVPAFVRPVIGMIDGKLQYGVPEYVGYRNVCVEREGL